MVVNIRYRNLRYLFEKATHCVANWAGPISGFCTEQKSQSRIMNKTEEYINHGSTPMITDKRSTADKTQSLPEEWECKKLRDICEYDKKQGDYHKPYVGLEDIESNTGKYLGSMEAKKVKSTTFYFNKHHLLYGRLRPYLNKVLVPEFEGHCSTEIFPLKVNSEINRHFLARWLMMENIVSKINSTCTGARMPRANMNAVLDFIIPVPPLTEQKRIVAILDEVFAAIDKAKANAEKNLANAKELFESYLNGIFANPGEDWEERNLNHISENLDSKRKPVTKRDRKKGEHPYYGASGIVDYVDDYIFEEDLLLISEDGANLLARTYPIAFSIHGKTWVNNHAHVLRFNNSFTQKFVQEYLNHTRIDEYVSGMAQPKLNQRMLNQIPIFLPDVKEQKVIVKKIDKISSEIKHFESIYQQKIAALEGLKESILKKAFEGEL